MVALINGQSLFENFKSSKSVGKLYHQLATTVNKLLLLCTLWNALGSVCTFECKKGKESRKAKKKEFWQRLVKSSKEQFFWSVVTLAHHSRLVLFFFSFIGILNAYPILFVGSFVRLLPWPAFAFQTGQGKSFGWTWWLMQLGLSQRMSSMLQKLLWG